MMSDRSTVIAVCQSLIIIADEANEEILLTKSNINNLNDALKCIKKQLSKKYLYVACIYSITYFVYR